MSGSAGYSIAIRNVHNNLYGNLQREAHKSTTSSALHWRGASYGGLSVNIGVAVDSFSHASAYLKPMAYGSQLIAPES